MSKYTTEVRFICESAAGMKESVGFDKIDSVLTKAAPVVFNFQFPIFDENYRLPLEVKILSAFYTREICEETVGLWKLRLRNKLNQIMPYYNQLYESATISFNPMYDVDITRNHKTTTEGSNVAKNDRTDTTNGTQNVEGITNVEGTTTRENEENDALTIAKENTDIMLYSDTPQGGINGLLLDMGNGESNNWLTQASKTQSNGNDTHTDKITSNGTDTVKNETTVDNTTTTNNTVTIVENGSNTINNTEDYIEHVKGKQGTASYAKMLEEYRKTFLNIDAMIIKELEPLFFGLWD